MPGLAGIDVRQLTQKIRETGSMKAKVRVGLSKAMNEVGIRGEKTGKNTIWKFQLVIESDEANKFDFVDINEENLVALVSRKVCFFYPI